ncbi:MAG: hypothetical protein KAT25_11390 [Sulfuriflexus sp.]|nr:hypothetical protein [Sulfuriflexus sp.]
MTVFLFVITAMGCGTDKTRTLKVSCQNYSWSDVEVLVQPHLDDVLFTALVMQGQSANYKTSAAAEQAMDEALPEDVKGILRALINANC